MTTLDLADNYHQFRLEENSKQKTAFTSGGCQWMFNVAPFGLQILTGCSAIDGKTLRTYRESSIPG